MIWRVVRSTDRGYVIASVDFDDYRYCVAACREAAEESDDYFAIQEMPSGAIVWDPYRVIPSDVGKSGSGA